MSFTEDLEKALAAVKKVKAIADKIQNQIPKAGEPTETLRIELTAEEAVMAAVALRNAVDGL